MTHPDSLIEQVKAEIRFQAKWAGIPFDEEDIEHHEIEGHTLVALMRIKTPETEIQGDKVVVVGEKTPNIWVTYPSPLRAMPPMGEWITSIKVSLPDVHILRPSLVFLILPDGTINGNEGFVGLHKCIVSRNAESHLAHLLGDIWNRPGECRPIEATCS